jgi:integrase
VDLFRATAKERRCSAPSATARTVWAAPSVRLCTAQCLRLAGLKRPGISNHTLRHYAATLGYLHTGDLRTVQDFLGHADPRMTSRYAHVVDMAKRNPALFIPVKVG